MGHVTAAAGRRGGTSGLVAGTTAGLVWGLAFLLPVLLPGWTAMTVTAGRYLAYGAVSLVLFAVGGRRIRALARGHWRPALAFALTGNVGYYLLLVLGIDLAGAPVTDIVIGCIPVAVTLAGNLSDRRYAWRALAFPVALVVAGLLIVNLLQIETPARRAPLAVTFLGLLAALGAVVLWTWYALANARFLDRSPDVSYGSWSTVVGLGTGVIALAALPVAAGAHQLGHSSGPGPGVAGLVGASFVLGAVVSWGATSLWNLASGRLAATAAGMLINVETVAGFAYVYAARGRFPPAGQLVGFALILSGVLIVVRLRPVPGAPGGSGTAGWRRTAYSPEAGMALSLPIDPDANKLLSGSPLALLIAMLLDQQVPLEKAFSSPYVLTQRLGHEPTAVELADYDPEALAAVFSERPALHRFPRAMAGRTQELARAVVERYDGHAARIWLDASDGADLLRRLAELPGFGTYKAQILMALLGKQLGVQPDGWREAAGRFGQDGSHNSVADVVDAASLAAVRARKKQLKAAAAGTAR